MPIYVEWDNQEKTIIHQRYDQEWTVQDLEAAIDMTYQMIDKAESKSVNIIADLDTSHLPGFEIFSSANHYSSHKHARQGIYVVVGKSRILSVVQTITQIARLLVKEAREVMFADNLDEARLILAKLSHAAKCDEKATK